MRGKRRRSRWTGPITWFCQRLTLSCHHFAECFFEIQSQENEFKKRHMMSAFRFLFPVTVCCLFKDSYSGKLSYLRRKSAAWQVNRVLSAVVDIRFGREPEKLWGGNNDMNILEPFRHHLVLLEAAPGSADILWKTVATIATVRRKLWAQHLDLVGTDRHPGRNTGDVSCPPAPPMLPPQTVPDRLGRTGLLNRIHWTSLSLLLSKVCQNKNSEH